MNDSTKAFLAWSDQKPHKVKSVDGKYRNGVLVMSVAGLAAALPALTYIEKVADFKDAVRTGKTETQGNRTPSYTLHLIW